MVEIEGGLFELGYKETGRDAGEPPAGMRALQGMPALQGMRALQEMPALRFAFDNEKPEHKVFLQDFLLDRAPVSNENYLEFINAGGYQDFRWWYSAGWEKVEQENWQAPLYWEQHDGEWMIRDFG